MHKTLFIINKCLSKRGKNVKNWLENEPKETLICAVVSAISLVLSITGVLKNVLPFDIAWVAIILCGVPILVGAFKGVIFEHDIKADLLVSLALIASAATKEYFAAGEVALIMQIGSLLEDYTSGKAREGIEKLISITPQTARVVNDGVSTVVPVEEVRIGDKLSVLAGETIPVDGTILDGETSIDQSVMTGESIPVDKKAGDKVSSGTINQYSTFTMRADSVSKDSSLQRMVRLAEEAEEKQSSDRNYRGSMGDLACSDCAFMRSYHMDRDGTVYESSNRFGCFLPLCIHSCNTDRSPGGYR